VRTINVCNSQKYKYFAIVYRAKLRVNRKCKQHSGGYDVS
jgi:hypothetical protein